MLHFENLGCRTYVLCANGVPIALSDLGYFGHTGKLIPNPLRATTAMNIYGIDRVEFDMACSYLEGKTANSFPLDFYLNTK